MQSKLNSKAEADLSLKEYYEKYGYVVIENAIDPQQIDALLDEYKKEILPSKDKFYRQNRSGYERNQFTPAGHVIQSFIDIHHLKSYPKFRKISLDIFFGQALLPTLSQITGSPKHKLMQSMLFDANAETPPHQDWWYLDTVPNGSLIGAWIALEDIAADAGRFYVVPGTHELVLHEPNMPHSKWMGLIRDYVASHPEQVHAPALKKGSILFWNSRTIHGALPTKNKSLSRKSLTAHYIPANMEFGNLFLSKPWISYEEYEGNLYFANQPEYSLKADLASRLKLFLYDSPRILRLARKFQKSSVSDL